MKKILLIMLFTVAVQAKGFALIVGVDGGNLIGTTNDVESMNRVLKNKNITYIKKIINSEATKISIIKEFKKIVKEASKGADNKVYFFFSGHGTNEYDRSISKNLRAKLKGTGALVPYGADSINYGSLLVIKRDLAKSFRELEKHNVKTIVMFDTCFSGSAYKDSFLPKRLTREFHKYPYKHLIFLASSIKLSKSAESTFQKQGYFSLALTECLKGANRLNTLRSCLKNTYDYTPTILPKKGKQKLF
jgi:hypothetical protein